MPSAFKLPVRDWSVLLATLAGTFAVAGTGSWITAAAIPDWYATLIKPNFNPPNWLFGPVWTTLYLMMSIAFWLSWRSAPASSHLRLIGIYVIQLAANLAWSILFFGMHWIFAALIDCLFLFGCIGVMMKYFSHHSRVSSWLLLPYAAWVAFASFLNGAIVWLN